MVSLCRAHNPDATIVVDGTTLLTLQRPDLADDLVADDELAGRDTVTSLRRQRDREVIALADHIWVCSQSERNEIETLNVATNIRVVRQFNLWENSLALKKVDRSSLESKVVSLL